MLHANKNDLIAVVFIYAIKFNIVWDDFLFAFYNVQRKRIRRGCFSSGGSRDKPYCSCMVTYTVFKLRP